MRLWHLLYTVPLRLRSLFRRRQVEQDLDDEIRYHIEQRIEEEIARGASPEKARLAALRAMDGLEQRKEECRDMRRTQFIDQFLRDVRYAWRSLLKSPAFAAVTLLSLAFGIGFDGLEIGRSIDVIVPVSMLAQVATYGRPPRQPREPRACPAPGVSFDCRRPQGRRGRKCLCSCEGEERADVMVVGGAQGLDVARPRRAGLAEPLPSPRESLAVELQDEQVGHQAGVAAIAVREGVDPRQPVMKAHCDLVGRIRVIFHPGFNVVDQLAELRGDQPVVDADVALAGPQSSGPPPHVTQHAPVKIPDELLAQQVPPAAVHGPLLRADDILLFRRIQVPPIRNVAGDEVARFLRRERRRRLVALGKDVAHRSSHNRLGFIVRINSSSCASESLAPTA
jgi:hypothetical protein